MSFLEETKDIAHKEPQSKAEVSFFRVKYNMESVAQLVRASDCGSEGRGFEPHHFPR